MTINCKQIAKLAKRYVSEGGVRSFDHNSLGNLVEGASVTFCENGPKPRFTAAILLSFRLFQKTDGILHVSYRKCLCIEFQLLCYGVQRKRQVSLCN